MCLKTARVGAGRSARGRLDHPGCHFQLERDVLARLDTLRELAAPGLESVDPALDRELVAAEPAHGELAAPAVVDDGQHRRLGPARVRLVPVKENARERV